MEAMGARSAVILVLLLANFFIFSAAAPRRMTVSFFDVGQGDSIFIESPTGVQVVVDGGADRSVLRELGRRMPFFDRTIDGVIATHPDQDHIGGLVDVFERYRVGMFIESGAMNDTLASAALISAAEKEGAPRLLARRGMRLVLGGGAYADILFPDRDVANSTDTNNASIILRLAYGETSFMLTGDASSRVEQELFFELGYALDADVLKAGHHGSKTSSLPDFVESVSPEYVVFSRGCDNRYGHPHESVRSYFESQKIKILDTCEDGTITFRSDGTTLRPPF